MQFFFKHGHFSTFQISGEIVREKMLKVFLEVFDTGGHGCAKHQSSRFLTKGEWARSQPETPPARRMLR